MSAPAVALRPGRRPFSGAASQPAGAKWVYGFVAAQIFAQLGLVLLDVGGFRTMFRIVAFGLSLAFLVLIPGKSIRHPAFPAIAVVLGIFGVQLFHPTTNTVLAGAGQIGLSLAILAPVFWVARLRLDAAAVRRTIWMFWLFHASSAALGVLQVYFPGKFQPNVSSVILDKGEGYVDSLQIQLQSGEQVLRPMGLTDIPGGAATSGFYTVLFGIGFLLSARDRKAVTFYGAAMALAMASIYLSQVRVMLVMLFICLAGAAGLLAVRGYLKQVALFGGVIGAAGAVGLAISFSLAQETVSRRLNSLISGSAASIYHQNRGIFLEHTFQDLLPRYPFGAGLGRWGMMNTYFGNHSDFLSSPIWVEIQWTGWILDGGLPMALAYLAALIATGLFAANLALRRRGRTPDDLWIWAVVLSGYNLGALAMTFSYPIFISQSGMEFWLLNALLFTATATRTQAAAAMTMPTAGPGREATAAPSAVNLRAGRRRW